MLAQFDHIEQKNEYIFSIILNPCYYLHFFKRWEYQRKDCIVIKRNNFVKTLGEFNDVNYSLEAEKSKH